MADVYLYLDETGDLDVSGKAKASPYFGLGSAMFVGEHAQQVWEGMRLRLNLEAENLRLPDGMHAYKDKPTVRHRVLNLIARHRPRIDVTLLKKDRAYPSVQAKMRNNKFYIYQYAWYVHFRYLARFIIPRHLEHESDRAYIVVATLGTGEQKEAARQAIESVCKQFPKLNMTVCIWDNKTAWGLQVADYALWTTHRRVRDGRCKYYHRIHPLIKTVYRPWERLNTSPAISADPPGNATDSKVVEQASSAPTRNPEALDHFSAPHWWEELPGEEWEDISDEDDLLPNLAHDRWAPDVPDTLTIDERDPSDIDRHEPWLDYVPDVERLVYTSSDCLAEHDDEELPEEWRDETY